MQLILAIDSDPRRSEQLATLVRNRFTVDLVQATSAGEGLHALRDRVPDLILTAPLLSPFDDGVLDEYLRDLGGAATHVQTVRIPMLSAPPKKKTAKSLFGLGRKKKPTSSAAPDGCDPKVFADEIAHYLTRSLETRSASSQARADKTAAPAQARASEHQTIAQPVEDFDVAETLIEEFTAPVHDEPAPIYTAPAVEERYVPGTILDLRPTPVIAVRQPEFVVEPEPLVAVEPDAQTFVEPESLVIIEPEVHAFVAPEQPVIIEPEVPALAEPVAAASAPNTMSAPAASATPTSTSVTPTGTSPSFEAALAAIRAAWAKPEDKKAEAVVSVPPSRPTSGRPTPPLAGSSEVDLTNEIDALEDVVGADAPAPVADDEPSSDESKLPADRRKLDTPRKRPEKARGRTMQGLDGRDESGVFDPNQCDFSALVNKLDEVTEDEVTGRATTTVR